MVPQEAAPSNPLFRILHVVTALTEYDKGTRGTTRGADRLVSVLIPALNHFLQSVAREEPSWHVDVVLILGFEKLEGHRRKLIEDILPPGVGLQVWEDAVPFYYERGHNEFDGISRLNLATHALARQHRFVIKDKLEEYDFFSAWVGQALEANSAH